ncbi:MAG TPA: 3-hydroxyacyl-CoA dehydrogenase NAD-binding domain-containing protein [Candidatus Acidoferrales bacterium]|nr:3-hydroxyacyl-CoA dehydrogenase NAD-binding domain-containing protein [Candidatus Acidoferrales bacterium]
MAIFRLEERSNGLIHLVMDDPARKLNVLDEPALASLERSLAELEARREVTGIVVRSGKPGSFIAGADVHAIGSITDAAQVRALVRRGQGAFSRLASLPAPTVAAIEGPCLGGGLELALACSSRVAAEERAQIGLPEVLLGIFPGFGGTTRLPRLVGLVAACDLILSGRTLDAKRAERMGVIARAVPAAWLVESAERRVAELARRSAEGRRDAFRPRTAAHWALDANPFGRAVVLRRARADVRVRTGGHYPAPLAALEVLERGIGGTVERSLALEEELVTPLLVGAVCKNLVRIFLLSEDAKRKPVVDGVEPARVERLALAGAGVMGGGIAELASRSGLSVRLRDVRPEALQKGLRTVRDVIDERGRRRRTGEREKDAQMAHVLPTLELSGFQHADFAIEAVVEDLDVKRRVFAELEVRMREDAVLASNTSSLRVDALADGLRHPGRFVGVHFFNPVHRMPLVEVVRGAKTTDAALATAVSLARRLGKTPVVVRDSPGFVVNRVLMPYLREAMHLLEEGHPLPTIDRAMRRFGMPMGPFEVVDEVGLDVSLKVAGVLAAAFPGRMQPAPLLEKLIASGRLGKKNGRGFYRHRGRERTPDPTVPALLGLPALRSPAGGELLTERMGYAMVNEAARCLEEGIVADAGAVDLAMIMGAGFPPFRGGVLRWADTVGLARVLARLRAFRAEKGERYEPCALLVAKAEAGGTFTAPPVATPPVA